MTQNRERPVYAKLDLAGLGSTRRVFVGGGAAMVLAFAAKRAFAAGEEPGLNAIKQKAGPGEGQSFQGFAPGGFIRLGQDGTITLIMPNAEVGQGIYTAEAMMLAEELEVGLDQVMLDAAPPDEQLYRQPLLGSQSTGGSTSVRGAWAPLRQAGAAARTMLIAAAAARWRVDPKDCVARRAVISHQPTRRQLRYADVIMDAARQPVPRQVALKDPGSFELIGKSIPRFEGPAKCNGSAVYGMDVKVPGMKIAAVVACPVFGGKVKSVDDKAARTVEGVRDVVRTENSVAVIADHFWAAKTGLERANIEWDFGPNQNVDSGTMLDQLRNAHGNVKPIVARHDGDVDGAMQRAAKKVQAEYELPFLAHAPMEPINTLVHVRPDGCEIWVGTQVPTAAQKTAARVCGLPPEKVIIHNFLMGGAFGRRLETDSIEQAVAIAKQVDYPVKVIWTREEDIQHDYYRPLYFDRIAAGLDGNGMPIAWTDTTAGASILHHYAGLPIGQLDRDAVEGAKEPPYALPAIHVDWVRQDPPVPISWWRGVGPTHNVFVVESFMDELAHAAGKDPVEYRLSLLQNNPRAANVLRIAAQRANWGSPLPQGAGRGISLHDSFGSFVAAVVEAEVTSIGEIKLRRITTAVDCGIVVNPDLVHAQMEGGLIFGLSAALYNGVTFSKGRVDQSNFNDYRTMRINEVPPIDIHIVDSKEDPGGVGETGTVSAAPSLGNALFAATGKRLRRLPFDRRELRAPDVKNKVISGLQSGKTANASMTFGSR